MNNKGTYFKLKLTGDKKKDLKDRKTRRQFRNYTQFLHSNIDKKKLESLMAKYVDELILYGESRGPTEE